MLSPTDFIKEVYLSLMEDGWTLFDIDEMDFFYYLDLLVYKANKGQKKVTIDQIF
jgi:hypothetical protein